jgi:hypothetical protein
MTGSSTARCAARALVYALALAAGAMPVLGPAGAEQLRVSATVRPVLRVQVDPVVGVEVSENDLRLGYVDPAAPLRVGIVTNSAEPAHLLLGSGAPMVQEVFALQEGGAGAPRLVSDLQVGVPPGGGMRRTELALRLRFYLSASATVGAHRWPVRVSVLPQ